MHRHTRSDVGEVSSARSSRAASFSSDRPSIAGSISFQLPPTVRPPPAYIAASVASQIVTDHQNAQLRDDFESTADDAAPLLVNAIFSHEALVLLNAFLDHLLYSFLSSAHSPSLTAIRPAITDVLKPRLAHEAMATADEELQGLLAGEDDEEFPSLNGQQTPDKWDVEKVWKRTRLRIMVYTRLGELEDEDEERYVQQERALSLDDSVDDEAGLVSWASAIFLTSIIEHIAEQTLVASGQAAFARLSAKMKKQAQQSGDNEESQLERIIVEEFDVEKIALNSALGRLWRTWRKRVRSPIVPLSPRSVRNPSISAGVSLPRRGSHDTGDGSTINTDPERSLSLSEVPEHTVTETDIAANIPLPEGPNDVNEIEVPGLARYLDEEDSDGTETPIPKPGRPASSILLSSQGLLNNSSEPQSRRERPTSMPVPEPRPFTFPAPSAAYDDAFVTPMERMSEDKSYIEETDEIEGLGPTALTVKTPVVPEPSTTTTTILPSRSQAENDETTETPTQGGNYSEPEVLQSKRVSIEKSGPPGIVRTFSVRSSRSSSGQRPAEERSYLDDEQTDNEENDGRAIGLARTTDVPVPVRATPSPPVEPKANGIAATSVPDTRQRVPERVMKADQPPNRSLSASPAPRASPSPMDKPTMSEKTPLRREGLPPRSTSASHRSPALGPLQESESWSTTNAGKSVPEKRAVEVPRPAPHSPKHASSRRSRELPIGERQQPSSEGSQGGFRSRSGTADGFPQERATLQRVPSAASTTKSANTSILHSARGSETSLSRPRGLSGRLSEEDRQREFDSLVQREETVKYTLTPQSMRELDVSSPGTSPVRKNLGPNVRQESPVGMPESPKQTTSVTVYPRVNAELGNSFGAQPPPRSTSRGQSSVTSDRAIGASRTGSTRKAYAAREPRIQTESMRDFADFIRSTGPAPGEARPVQPFMSSSSSPSKVSSSKAPPSSSAMSSLGRKLSTKQQPTLGAGEGPSARPRIHMEPRSPAGQHSGNDDLIDFIRNGPPGASNGQHRIPRTVAPFRTTVDSDQFDQMLDDGNTASTFGSQVSTTSKQSTRTSANSRTGLLPTPTVVQPAYSNTPQHLAGSMSQPEPQITRTRRRIKDPYAIDSDDDDEDLLTALPKSRRQEESLMDFLNSADPPGNNDPQPLLISPEAAAAAVARARSANGAGAGPGRTSSRTNGASSAASAAMISSTITSQPRTNKPKLQARGAGDRDPRSGRSETNDLADFLRTSGPPEPVAPPPGATIKKEEGKRLNARFWRKKTYGDMP